MTWNALSARQWGICPCGYSAHPKTIQPTPILGTLKALGTLKGRALGQTGLQIRATEWGPWGHTATAPSSRTSSSGPGSGGRGQVETHRDSQTQTAGDQQRKEEQVSGKE